MSPICYASTDRGLTLPVIDITHPAFSYTPGADELAASRDAFLLESARRRRLPRWLHRAILRVVLRKTLIGPGLVAASGGFISGLDTYLLKLGPDNLPGAATAVDRRIAAAYPALSTRLRLQDMAQLMAGDLAARVQAGDARPIALVNIAGGPAADSLNALIVLRRTHADLLDGRLVTITVLDQDAAGPAFGARCLAALSEPGAPLRGLDIRWRHVPYDWTDPAALTTALAALRDTDAYAVVSSEGGLFEYGTDDAVVANLTAIADAGPEGIVVVGSVTRLNDVTRAAQSASHVRVRPRSREAFEALAARGGWICDRVLEQPFSLDVRLRRIDRVDP